MRSLRKQLTNIVNLLDPNLKINFDPKLQPPNSEQEVLLRQIITAGYPDHVAMQSLDDNSKLSYYYALMNTEDKAVMHPGSFLFDDKPVFCVYKELTKSERREKNEGKIFMRSITAINPSWLLKVNKPMCSLTKPLENPPPR